MLEAAKAVKAVEDALKESGAWHSMAKYQIISAANPTKRARKASDFDTTFDALRARFVGLAAPMIWYFAIECHAPLSFSVLDRLRGLRRREHLLARASRGAYAGGSSTKPSAQCLRIASNELPASRPLPSSASPRVTRYTVSIVLVTSPSSSARSGCSSSGSRGR